MWSRYLTNVEHPGAYSEECWMNVHSDASLIWLFEAEFLDAPISQQHLTPLFKRWKEMTRLRRSLADDIIRDQQIYTLKLQGRMRPKPASYSLPPRPPFFPTPSRPGKMNWLHNVSGQIMLNYGKHKPKKQLPSRIYKPPPPDPDNPKRDRRQQRLHPPPSHPPPPSIHIPSTPLADTASPHKYQNRSFGSSHSLDPPD